MLQAIITITAAVAPRARTQPDFSDLEAKRGQMPSIFPMSQQCNQPNMSSTVIN